MTKRELKQEIDQLRNDMAAEFVKRDDDIVATRTEGILARNALSDALANLEKRLKNTEEFVGVQTDSIAAIILACGLREEDKFNKACKQIKLEREKLKKLVEQKDGVTQEVVVCGGNRFEIIAKAKADILESTNIDSSPEEMKVLDNFLFRCWQMGWLDKYDKK